MGFLSLLRVWEAWMPYELDALRCKFSLLEGILFGEKEWNVLNITVEYL